LVRVLSLKFISWHKVVHRPTLIGFLSWACPTHLQ
jgi:hypothetical protein